MRDKGEKNERNVKKVTMIWTPSSHFSTPHEPLPPSNPYTGRGTGTPVASLNRHSSVWFMMYAPVS